MLPFGLNWCLDHELWYDARSCVCRSFEHFSPHASHHGCRPWFWRTCKSYNHFCNHDHRFDWFGPRYHNPMCAMARRYWSSFYQGCCTLSFRLLVLESPVVFCAGHLGLLRNPLSTYFRNKTLACCNCSLLQVPRWRLLSRKGLCYHLASLRCGDSLLFCPGVSAPLQRSNALY